MPRIDHAEDDDRDPDGPGEHDAHLLDDSETDIVPCPRCGKGVLAEAERCHRCGAEFRQEAWLAAEGAGLKAAVWALAAILVLAAMVYVLL